MKNLIREWGIWSRHSGYDKHNTPLLAFMRANGAVSYGSYNEPNITDEEALAVDKAVCKLRREYVVLYNVLFAHYVLGWSYRQISRRYLTPLEYPHQVGMDDTDSRKRFVHHSAVARMLEQAKRIVYKNIH
ncbi:antiterminator Q family protein [Moraxella equi]|nr:antiterminator Q family protein [Moraxella equi]STZ02015.1 Phage antitermination protein Q [Moraxella equi]